MKEEEYERLIERIRDVVREEVRDAITDLLRAIREVAVAHADELTERKKK